MSRLTASRAAFDLIASFEGFRTRAVLAPNGKWTLGFGHVATAREGLSVTRAEAEDLLRWDLLPIEDTIRQVALTPLTQNQFDALLSFAFNIGLDNFKQSEVLKYLNQGQPMAAALSMHAWRRARVNGRVLTIDALVRRRAAEAALFLEAVGARAAAPTSIVTPEIDQSATLAITPPSATKELKSEVQDTESKADEAAQIKASFGDDVSSGPSKAPPRPHASGKDESAKLQPKPVVLAQTATQDILKQPTPITPLVAPPLAKPTAIATERVLPPQSFDPPPKPKTGPIIPDGIAPFPAGPSFAAQTSPANNNGNNNLQSLPANDGYNTRLHSAPESIETPKNAQRASAKPSVPKIAVDRFALLTWVLMALGAALLAAGLFYAWKSGLLNVSSPKREPTSGELNALLAAASGFIMLATSAAAAITANGRDEEG